MPVEAGQQDHVATSRNKLLAINLKMVGEKCNSLVGHIKDINLWRFYIRSIGVAIPVLWTVSFYGVLIELLVTQKIFNPLFIVIWVFGIAVLAPVVFLFWKISMLNITFSKKKAMEFLREAHIWLRYLSLLLIGTWLFSKIILLLHEELRHLTTMEFTVYVAELDILFPFGVVGALVLLLSRNFSDTERLIRGVRDATPAQRRAIYNVLATGEINDSNNT